MNGPVQLLSGRCVQLQHSPQPCLVSTLESGLQAHAEYRGACPHHNCVRQLQRKSFGSSGQGSGFSELQHGGLA